MEKVITCLSLATGSSKFGQILLYVSFFLRSELSIAEKSARKSLYSIGWNFGSLLLLWLLLWQLRAEHRHLALV